MCLIITEEMNREEFDIIVKIVDKIPALFLCRGNYEFIDINKKKIKVTLTYDIYIDLMKVQFIQFMDFIKSGAYFNNEYWDNQNDRKVENANQFFMERECDPWNPNEPILVTWNEAKAFTKWSEKRLPTENEWMILAALTEGMIKSVNGKELKLNRENIQKKLWEKVFQIIKEFDLDCKQEQFQNKFYPMVMPAEWCFENDEEKGIIKGCFSPNMIPFITGKRQPESSSLLSFRCCKRVTE